jgi:organic radical activating enzyme
MLYDFHDDKVVTKGIEYSVSYHCNLRCAGCSHMSPFTDKQYPSLDRFSSDIGKIRKVLHAYEFRLLGGEPLLNPEIDSFVRIAKESRMAEKVTVTTNGLFLHRMTDLFWENVDRVRVTLYPDTIKRLTNFLELIRTRARQSNTELCLDNKIVFRTTIMTKAQSRDWITDMIFKTCKNVHFWHCHMIHQGKLYKCAVPPFLPHYLSKIDAEGYNPADDAFDMHNSAHLFEELKAFLTSRKTLMACNFCLGFLGKAQRHHQLGSEYVSHPEQQRIMRETHLDYRKLTMESLQYFLRRLNEKMSGKHEW